MNWVRYYITQLCHKLGERGNPIMGELLPMTFAKEVCCVKHGWIFTHNVCSGSYYVSMGEFPPTIYTIQMLWSSHWWICIHCICGLSDHLIEGEFSPTMYRRKVLRQHTVMVSVVFNHLCVMILFTTNLFSTLALAYPTNNSFIKH